VAQRNISLSDFSRRAISIIGAGEPRSDRDSFEKNELIILFSPYRDTRLARDPEICTEIHLTVVTL